MVRAVLTLLLIVLVHSLATAQSVAGDPLDTKITAPESCIDCQSSSNQVSDNGPNSSVDEEVKTVPSEKLKLLDEDKANESLAADLTSPIDTFSSDSAKDALVKDRQLPRADKSGLPDKHRFRWKAAVAQSLLFLGIQHSFRMTQKRTTSQLGGPFFRDWFRSVKSLHGWKDGDRPFINYIAHPLQGGVTGRIFINNSYKAKEADFGTSKAYWKSRLKALAWSAAWSTQFELGPLSEASIGNVGLTRRYGRHTMAWVDLVITPTLGTGVVVLEDMADKFLLKNWIEKKFGSHSFQSKLYRVLFTPTTAFANILRGKPPWKRDSR